MNKAQLSDFEKYILVSENTKLHDLGLNGFTVSKI